MITGSDGFRSGGAGQLGNVEIDSGPVNSNWPKATSWPSSAHTVGCGQLGSQRQPGLAVAGPHQLLR